MAHSETVPPGATIGTLGGRVYSELIARMNGITSRVADLSGLTKHMDFTLKQKNRLYSNIYDEQETVWRTLFPGMTPEWIIENMIPGYVEAIYIFKYPNPDITRDIPMEMSDYVALGWIDPLWVSNDPADMPYHQYTNAMTHLSLSVIDRLASIENAYTLDPDRVPGQDDA